VQEDGGAVVALHRVVVPAEYADDVVQAVIAPQLLVPRRMGQPNGAVIGAVGRIVAPAIVAADRLDGGSGFGRWATIGPVEHPSQRQQADRAGAIALLFVQAHARRTQAAAPLLRPDAEEPVAQHHGLHQPLPIIVPA
jgi:hypothetical protein